MERLAFLPPGVGFAVSHQHLQLELDVRRQAIIGTTTLSITPSYSELKAVRLHSQQCTIRQVHINNKAAAFKHTDPYDLLKIQPNSTVHQHHRLGNRLKPYTNGDGTEELVITIPKGVKIEELSPYDTFVRSNTVKSLDTPAITPAPKLDELAPKYKALEIRISFESKHMRSGLQFVGWDEGDMRWPHVYTPVSKVPGQARCIFPCLDDMSNRCTWDIQITVPRTLGDAMRLLRQPANSVDELVKATSKLDISEEESALDMVVICSGELVDEEVKVEDSTKKITTYSCSSAVSPRHIGFAIGPFEYIDLAEYRDIEEDDKLGESAISIRGYSLPGRTAELRNTCLPMAKAIDYFTMTYGSYPFADYKLCFIDDMIMDTAEAVGLSLCSTRLLFPEDVIDPIDAVTRQLSASLASQWSGVDIVPKERTDFWIIIGIAYFMADMFLKKLSGNNDFRFRQKKASDRVCETDVRRPSMHASGELVGLDPSEEEFIILKSPLVLWILDRRLAKVGGSAGCARIISRIFLNAKVGSLSNNSLSTAFFIRTSEKLGHAKLESFFQQWVFGGGCPTFYVSQRFNKKKLVIEMNIEQQQTKYKLERNNTKETFLRDWKESRLGVKHEEIQDPFTGPMTFRIHEADGTPYEHIVEIKEKNTRIDIPYNTKYKRLKRTKKQKEKIIAGIDTSELQDDVLLYCLGDVLQTDEEITDWRLADWTKEQEDQMNQESFEWIRMDADFEWIAKMEIGMPGYMYLSQLQQDRDVVAQLESVQYIAKQVPTPLISTILVRTLMDRRYFHGIRTEAAMALAKQNTITTGPIGYFHLDKAFQTFYCIPGTNMTRSNDFSDRVSYLIQCAIPTAVSQIRQEDGNVPTHIKRFLFDKLKFNDNANNRYSDATYVATLMNGLCQSLLPSTAFGPPGYTFETEASLEDIRIQQDALKEIGRYRRMDEWVASYQNTLSKTALVCTHRLVDAGLIPLKERMFVQYLQEGTSEGLKISAMSAMVDLGLLDNMKFAILFFHLLSKDPSPVVRFHLQRLFGEALGSLAITDPPRPNVPPEEDANGDNMVIETEGSSAQRADVELRLKQLEPARDALTKIMNGDDRTYFKPLIWSAVSSKALALGEIQRLLDICDLLYDTDDALIVTLRYPRYWAVKHHGDGKLAFKQTSKIRTKMRPKAKGKSQQASGAAAGVVTKGAAAAAASASLAIPNGSDAREPVASGRKRKSQSPPPGESRPLKLKINPLKLSNSLAVGSASARSPAPGAESPKVKKTDGEGSEKKPTFKLKLKLGPGK